MDGEELLSRTTEWGKRLKSWGLKKSGEYSEKGLNWGKGFGKAAARDMTLFGKDIAKSRPARAIAEHPYKYILPAAIALGVYQAHPIKATHPLAFAQDLAFDDPHVFRTIAYSSANNALTTMFSNDTLNRARNAQFDNYTMGNSGNSYYGNYSDPSYGYIASIAAKESYNISHGAISVGTYNDDLTYGEAMIRQQQQDNPRYGLSGQDLQGPDGRIVFGMYNQRLNG